MDLTVGKMVGMYSREFLLQLGPCQLNICVFHLCGYKVLLSILVPHCESYFRGFSNRMFCNM